MTAGYLVCALGWRPLLRRDAQASALCALVAAVSSIMTLAIATMYIQGVGRPGMLWVSFLSGAVITTLLQLPWLRFGNANAFAEDDPLALTASPAKPVPHAAHEQSAERRDI